MHGIIHPVIPVTSLGDNLAHAYNYSLTLHHFRPMESEYSLFASL